MDMVLFALGKYKMALLIVLRIHDQYFIGRIYKRKDLAPLLGIFWGSSYSMFDVSVARECIM